MILELNSNKLNFCYQLRNGRWLTKPTSDTDLWIASAPMTLIWLTDRTGEVWLSDHIPTDKIAPSDLESDHGNCTYLRLSWADDTRLIQAGLEIHNYQTWKTKCFVVPVILKKV